MAQHKPSGRPGKGIYRGPANPANTDTQDQEQRVAEFSYQNDALAELIVEAWTDTAAGGFYDDLTTGNENQRTQHAKRALDDRGIHLMKPIVITETEYYAGYTMSDNAGVVFVLPDADRVDTAKPLLEAAKLLMACTPNGI
jgi:hypothetical protein